MKLIRWLLFPFALMYSAVVFCRNRFYDWGWYKTYNVDVPAIVVGNLSAGGTGKTPHTEMLVRLLSKEYFTAILSRGYGRRTRGFLMADEGLTANEIGDEPFQYHQKFDDEVMIAVDEDRKRGICMLNHQIPHPDVILLDDAFQHRKITAGLNILLTDYRLPFYDDLPLPTGNLRDNQREKRRADIIIVTKCPQFLSDEEQQNVIRKIKPEDHQKVFFSTITYGKPIALFDAVEYSSCAEVFAFTGIANPKSFIDHLEKNFKLFGHKRFPDHHHFKKSDFKKIRKRFEHPGNEAKCMLTTEKDAMRILHHPNKNILSDLPLYYVPIEVHLLKNVKAFDQHIINFVSSFN